MKEGEGRWRKVTHITRRRYHKRVQVKARVTADSYLATYLIGVNVHGGVTPPGHFLPVDPFCQERKTDTDGIF